MLNESAPPLSREFAHINSDNGLGSAQEKQANKCVLYLAVLIMWA